VTSPKRIGPAFRTGAFCFCWLFAPQNPVSGMELSARSRDYTSISETEAMLVERGIQVMNVGVVGDAYAIASNYLRRTGAIAVSFATNDRLLEIIVQMFHRGEFNKIRLANRAIAKFEAEEAAQEAVQALL
jgi:hypothetical protein